MYRGDHRDARYNDHNYFVNPPNYAPGGGAQDMMAKIDAALKGM